MELPVIKNIRRQKEADYKVSQVCDCNQIKYL